MYIIFPPHVFICVYYNIFSSIVHFMYSSFKIKPVFYIQYSYNIEVFMLNYFFMPNLVWFWLDLLQFNNNTIWKCKCKMFVLFFLSENTLKNLKKLNKCILQISKQCISYKYIFKRKVINKKNLTELLQCKCQIFWIVWNTFNIHFNLVYVINFPLGRKLIL